MDKRVGVLITSHNDSPEQLNRCLKSVYGQNYVHLLIECVDDGSIIPVEKTIDFSYDSARLQITRIPHSERAMAREVGLSQLKMKNIDYLLFLDSDMVLCENALEELLSESIKQNWDGVVIPEEAYSIHQNYWTKVKIFERNLYQSGQKIGRTSIEAARFWRMDRFPGFVSGLNAFEEIQPTLRCLEQGGSIGKIAHPYIQHDEKKVELQQLLFKKGNYFSQMGTHNAVKWTDLLQKFYFFRIQLYHPKNIKKYMRHPALFAGVAALYILQTMLIFVRFFRPVKQLGRPIP